MIQYKGDEQDQAQLVNVGNEGVLIIYINTAGGIEEQGDEYIYDGLRNIFNFLKDLHQGRFHPQPSFKPLPLLVKRSEEQVEEEDGNEEVDAQQKNKGFNEIIKYEANLAKAEIL
ncbi:MAG: hypothetical protein EZS28_053248, partial [Streblomastix strix]